MTKLAFRMSSPMENSEKQEELHRIQEFRDVYSPSTILGVYANALRTQADTKIILAKGEFHPSNNGKEYSGYYYDDIKSPNDNKFLKTKIPALLRSKLEASLIYLFKGYIEKRISNSTIELIFVVDEVLQREENPISEEDLKRFELIQKKVSKGYRDIEAVIKEHIYSDKPFRIVNIFGTTGIVDQDFEKGIAEAKLRYKVSEYRCNLSSKEAIINSLRKFNTDEYDAIALIRGGGQVSSMDIFNSPEIGEEILNLKPMFISALGHVANESLIDRIADKKFHLPHDYGNKLKVWVDEAAAEQAKSKSIFIDQVKKDLTKTFEDQLKTKDEAINNLKKTYEETTKQKDESLKHLQKTYEESSQQLVKMAIAETQTKFDALKVENLRLNQQVAQASKFKWGILIWILISILIGLLFGIVLSSKA